jgi:hypothetical protein
MKKVQKVKIVHILKNVQIIKIFRFPNMFRFEKLFNFFKIINFRTKPTVKWAGPRIQPRGSALCGAGGDSYSALVVPVSTSTRTPYGLRFRSGPAQ